MLLQGRKLYKPRSALVYLNGPSVTTSDGAAPAPRPLTLRASSVWENKDGALSGLIHMLKHSASGLAEEIVARRHYVKPERTLDPRFLVFEFITGFLLRKRQYELVTDFLSAHKRGESSVHQMIMGAGKTTVVGPLLALMLADGQRLVTQVCPGPLLEMTRSEMRGKFSNVICKRIYTLTFDRSSLDSNDVARLQRLFVKLDGARRERAIVCTTPEASKEHHVKVHRLSSAGRGNTGHNPCPRPPYWQCYDCKGLQNRR